MANLTKLCILKDGDFVTRTAGTMETFVAAIKETTTRRHGLERFACWNDAAPTEVAQARILAKSLSEQDYFDPVCSPANPLFTFLSRGQIIPHVLQQAEFLGAEKVTVATLIPRHGLMTPDELMAVTAAELKAALRSALNRAGAAQAKGWLLAGLHGSFDLATKLYQLHWHLVVAGGMIDVVDALRNQQQYRSSRDEPDGKVFQRVMIRRKPITDMARALTYIMQGFWPCRWVGTTEDGDLTRLSRRRRIPEPYHSRWLLWMHRQNLSNLMLPMHLEVEKGMLKVR
ncbi:hypothetical protein [Sphingomonas bacterium]|uniref:hypothetical protein n=1 Tax=Sphingomonas bacterium TaxID=1895847 RepID=UPI001575D4F0|nr:hypothetical protein [Sphingomonas bacterium]